MSGTMYEKHIYGNCCLSVTVAICFCSVCEEHRLTCLLGLYRLTHSRDCVSYRARQYLTFLFNPVYTRPRSLANRHTQFTVKQAKCTALLSLLNKKKMHHFKKKRKG